MWSTSLRAEGEDRFKCFAAREGEGPAALVRTVLLVKSGRASDGVFPNMYVGKLPGLLRALAIRMAFIGAVPSSSIPRR